MKNTIQMIVFIFVLVLTSNAFAQNISFLEFDGDDSYFVNDASNKLDVTGSNWTLEFWVYPTTNTVPASGTFPAIISRKYSFEVYFRNNGSSGSQLGIGVIALSGSGTGFDIEATVTSGTTDLTLDTWHHVAVSYDGTTTRLFFDGTEVGSSTDPDFNLDASIAAINFGARYNSGFTRYITDCALDEIRYSKTARYTSNFTIGTSSHPFTTDANTILLYHLNEDTGTSIANDNDSDFDTNLRASPNDATWRSYDYYSDDLPLQMIVDGNLTDDLYEVIASKENSNSGFGTDIDVNEIRYYSDIDNSVLYLGVVGKLNTSTSDGIGIWINTSSSSGVVAGTSLGISGAGHYIGGNGGSNPNFKADFEVDYMFAINPGGGASNVYFDAASQVASPAIYHYQGACDQSGTSTTNSSEDGTVFTTNAVTFAFDNGGGSDQGFELAIPFSELGVSSSDNIQVFAFVVSSTAYFSDVTVPGNITSGNPGNDVDFGSLSGGDFHSTLKYLPVELKSFTAAVKGNNVKLNWATATEINNYGFQVERKNIHESGWEEIGFVQGHGVSNSTKYYSYIDNPFGKGSYSYRLKQIDLDGAFKYSEAVTVDLGAVNRFALKQNYPNPFNPTTEISFDVPKESRVKLSVYNALGQKVADLLNKKLSAGTHRVRFDGSALSSGIYFYRMQSNGFTAIKKMILMK